MRRVLRLGRPAGRALPVPLRTRPRRVPAEAQWARRPWPAAWLAACVATGGGCASLEPLPLRPEPSPYADTLPIPEPRERRVLEVAESFKAGLIDEVGKVLDTRNWAGKEREALNVTHFDDVVGSAWFEHRNGRRPMSPEEVRAGAAASPGPDTSRALVVLGGKREGVMPGFTVRDARGDRYLFKFDPGGHLRLASSADVIASRLFFAAGYHTPADYLVEFDPRRLVLAEDAEITVEGRPRRMARSDVEEILARADPLPDGRYLALASRFVPGKPKGPFALEGRRKDDPNDHYHHEYRRELRGLFVVSAWLNHIDMREGNTLDAYIDPPGYLRHYLIDFASSLGSGGIAPHRPREGREHNFDLWPTMARLVTLGFYRVGWEGEQGGVIHPAVGWLPVEGYDPGAWKPNWPSAAWRLMTPADGYWGAKLVASFTDEQLRAAVEAGRLPAPAADTLAAILAWRRDRTVEHWYSSVAPIEEPAVEPAGSGGFRLTFEDRGLTDGVWSREETGYEWEFRHEERAIRWAGRSPAAAGPRQRLGVVPRTGSRLPAPARRGGLARLLVRAVRVRDGERIAGREATVYLRWDGSAYAVVGLFH